VTAFNSDGFTLGDYVNSNGNTNSYVAWAWDAGSSTVSNTDGSIASQVRAQPSAGFSIVGYTGNGSSNQSVGHNLNAAPKLVIFKRRSGGTSNWQVYHESIGITQRLALNTTDAAISAGTLWGNGMTSSVLGIGPGSGVNTSGSNYIAYCFAPVEGYSAMGSYVGSSSFPFIYCGFRPRWIMIKASSSGGGNYNWAFVDTERSFANVANHTLAANLTSGESSFGNGASVGGPYNKIDILSNGFKLRENGAWGNENAVTYIYIAFAEHSFASNGGLAR
jgi:hypothetical protein